MTETTADELAALAQGDTIEITHENHGQTGLVDTFRVQNAKTTATGVQLDLRLVGEDGLSHGRWTALLYPDYDVWDDVVENRHGTEWTITAIETSN